MLARLRETIARHRFAGAVVVPWPEHI